MKLHVGGLVEGLEELNRYLVGAGKPAHEEPVGEPWSCEFDGLEALRRIAAHLQYEKSLPREAPDEELLERYYGEQSSSPTGQGWIGFRKKPDHGRRFDHLIFHSDCEGFYLPRDFDPVLSSEEIPGIELGSVVRLEKELEILRRELGIPDGAELVLNEKARFAQEKFACLALLEGCRRSLKSGAALVFT